MTASADQLAEIRSWIGDATPPDDTELQVAWERIRSIPGVALSVMRGRRAALLADPAKLSEDGELSEDWTANLDAYNTMIRQLEGLHAAEAADSAAPVGVVSVGQLTRVGRAR